MNLHKVVILSLREKFNSRSNKLVIQCQKVVNFIFELKIAFVLENNFLCRLMKMRIF